MFQLHVFNIQLHNCRQHETCLLISISIRKVRHRILIPYCNEHKGKIFPQLWKDNACKYIARHNRYRNEKGQIYYMYI